MNNLTHKDNKKKIEANERARLKVGYSSSKKLKLNESSGASDDDDNDDDDERTTGNNKGKRKERSDDNVRSKDVEVGLRVKVKFEDGKWYEGNVISLKRGKVGEVMNIKIGYDDGDEEECKWPDKDIIIIGSDETNVKEKKKKKVRNNDLSSEFDVREVDGTRMFICGEGRCEYYSPRASTVKRHKANIHDIDVTYHFCGEDGCDFKSKHASDLKCHRASIHDIDVTYYLCGEEGCDYKAKLGGNIKIHRQRMHK